MSSFYTPQKNGITERRNRLVYEAIRAMLFENDVPKTFWREAINTIVYTLNKIQIKKGIEKTPYELWFGYVGVLKQG